MNDLVIKNRWLSLFLIFVVCGFAEASNSRTGAKSLLLTGSARESSMGDACVSAGDSVNSVNYNPAGIAFLEEAEVSFQHSSWLVGTKYEYMSFALPLKKGVMALTVTYLDYGSFTRRDAWGSSGGNFTAKDTITDISYASMISERVGLGARVRYFKQEIDTFSSKAVPFDLGIMYEISPKIIKAGFSAQNIGPKTTKFNTRREQLPLRYRIGLSIMPFSERGLICLEHNVINNEASFTGAGVEFKANRFLALRGGIVSSSEYMDGMIFKLGIGINIIRYYFDYSYEPFGELDTCHKFSMRVKF